MRCSLSHSHGRAGLSAASGSRCGAGMGAAGVAKRRVVLSFLLGLGLVPAAAAQTLPPGLVPGGSKSAAQSAPKNSPAPPSSAKPASPAKTIDAALRAEAERRAGSFVLTSADGERTCPLVLKPTAAGPGFALTLPEDGCPLIAFAAQAVAWIPDAAGSIRLLNSQGRTVAEFTEGAAGTYEALREGDGVYFIATPAALQADVVHPEELFGDWDLSRAPGTPVCRWTLTDMTLSAGVYAVRAGAGCEAGLAAFTPTTWRLEGGNVLITSGSGASTLRFARQEDGGWAKVPERGRPLLMSRP